MKRYLVLTRLMAALCCATAVAAVAAAADLRILTCEEPPTNYVEDGKVTGITTDIVRELMRRTGTGSDIELLPWARAYNMALRQAGVVLFTAGRTQQREHLFHWVGPIMIKRWVVYARATAARPFRTLDDLRAAGPIVVLRDDARSQMLARNGFTNLIRVNSHEQAVKMLYHKRANLYPSSDIEAPLIAGRAGVPFSSLRPVFNLKTIRPHIIISKGTPVEIVQAWQKAWRSVANDGTLGTIAARWAKKLAAPLTVEDGVIVLAAPPLPAKKP